MGNGKAMALKQNAPEGVITSASRWQQIKAILSLALDLGLAERGSYLDRACAEDSLLRLEIESLLAYEDDPDAALMDLPAIAPAPEESHGAEQTRRLVGPYEIVELIGSGGMGEVYRAVRADDQYRKEVAIKLVRTGLDTSSVIERFRGER